MLTAPKASWKLNKKTIKKKIQPEKNKWRLFSFTKRWTRPASSFTNSKNRFLFKRIIQLLSILSIFMLHFDQWSSCWSSLWWSYSRWSGMARCWRRPPSRCLRWTFLPSQSSSSSSFCKFYRANLTCSPMALTTYPKMLKLVLNLGRQILRTLFQNTWSQVFWAVQMFPPLQCY